MTNFKHDSKIKSNSPQRQAFSTNKFRKANYYSSHRDAHLQYLSANPLSVYRGNNEFALRLMEYKGCQLRVLNTVIWFLRQKDTAYISQKAFAKIAGVSTKTLVSYIERYKEDGILQLERTYVEKNKTLFNGPTQYTLTKNFNTRVVESVLGHVLPALKALALSLLFVTTSSFSNKNVFYREYGVANKRKVLKRLNTVERYSYTVDTHFVNGYPTKSVKNHINRYTISMERSRSGNVGTDIKRERLLMKIDACIPLHIEKIMIIKLTRAGKIAVSGYAEQVVREAERMMFRSQKSIRDPFRYFVACCEKISKMLHIPPDWASVNRLKEAYGYKDSMQMLTSNSIFKTAYHQQLKAKEELHKRERADQAEADTILPLVDKLQKSSKFNAEQQHRQRRYSQTSGGAIGQQCSNFTPKQESPPGPRPEYVEKERKPVYTFAPDQVVEQLGS